MTEAPALASSPGCPIVWTDSYFPLRSNRFWVLSPDYASLQAAETEAALPYEKPAIRFPPVSDYLARGRGRESSRRLRCRDDTLQTR